MQSTRARASSLAAILALAGMLGPPAGMAASPEPTASAASIAVVDAVRLSEFYRLLGAAGDDIWPGFTSVPAPVLLVTAEREFLVGWRDPVPEGFEDLGVDPRLGRTVRSRPRQFSPGMEASFPAFGPPAVIVFGTAEATGRTSAEWVLTLLHEHLHQLQYAAPGYYAEVEALDLAGSDTSGMWMLDYPFPYEDEAFGRRFSELAASLHAAVDGAGEPAMPWAALRALLDGLEPADARYLSFQLWQEGVGRYVELRGAEIAAAGYTSGAEFAALEDWTSWEDALRGQRERLVRGLEDVFLAEDGRTAFYSVGAALAVLLDRESPEWKSRYLAEKFAVDRYAGRVTGQARGEAASD